MSKIGNKIRMVFSEVALYKNPLNYDVFIGRNLPSFVKDYLISTHINPDGTLRREDLIAFLDNHIPQDPTTVKARLNRGETLTLLTRIVVSTNLAQNRTRFQIPDMGIKEGDTEIPHSLVSQYPEDLSDGEKWCIVRLTYVPPMENERGYVEMTNFKPFRPMANIDLDYFRQRRQEFTTEEWIDVIISAMEYDPDAFESQTQKQEFVSRLLPFVEPRLNMIELAPKGTGKSYVFGNISKYVWLVSGGKLSRAKLFYDRRTQQPGIVRFHDCVAFDEVKSISFGDDSEMQSCLKDYLESGKATFDNYLFMSECGLMLLGNIDLSEQLLPVHEDYFRELPESFKDTALIERFHGFIEGWNLPRLNNDMMLRDWTINVEFFSEILHQLRSVAKYSMIVNDCIGIPPKADLRHLKAVQRLTTAYMKLLFPHWTSIEDIDKEQFERYCLYPAIHRRDIIREQCSLLDREANFAKPIPRFYYIER